MANSSSRSCERIERLVAKLNFPTDARMGFTPYAAGNYFSKSLFAICCTGRRSFTQRSATHT